MVRDASVCPRRGCAHFLDADTLDAHTPAEVDLTKLDRLWLWRDAGIGIAYTVQLIE